MEIRKVEWIWNTTSKYLFAYHNIYTLKDHTFFLPIPDTEAKKISATCWQNSACWEKLGSTIYSWQIISLAFQQVRFSGKIQAWDPHLISHLTYKGQLFHQISQLLLPALTDKITLLCGKKDIRWHWTHPLENKEHSFQKQLFRMSGHEALSSFQENAARKYILNEAH